jgi:hypothetical protein
VRLFVRCRSPRKANEVAVLQAGGCIGTHCCDPPWGGERRRIAVLTRLITRQPLNGMRDRACLSVFRIAGNTIVFDKTGLPLVTPNG